MTYVVDYQEDSWHILAHDSIFLSFSFFLLWGSIRSLRMPVLRPASQAGAMRNPRDGTVV